MATPIIMPRQGQSVESCVISSWSKKVGDTVAEGDLLFTYETDKATFDENAKASGTLLAIFFNEGDDVPCLTNVCVIGNPGESYAEFDPNAGEKKEETPAPVVEQKVEAAPAVETASKEIKANEDGMIKISPRARMAAAEKGVNPAFVQGTGAEGRIIEKDILDASRNATYAAGAFVKEGITGTGIGGRVTTADIVASEKKSAEAPKAEAVKEAPAADAEFTDEKIPNIRKVISRTMHESLSNMAQLTLNSSFDATNIINFRKQLKENKEFLGIDNITINDIVLYAVSRVIMNHRDLNANFINDGTTMRYFKNCQLGVAVDTPRGLLVPTLRDANLKSLNEISIEAKELAKAAQGGTISPDLLKGGSFTVTNLGTLGIESFTPVINPPQTGILGVDTLMTRVKNVNGEMKMYQAMGLSLTFDHRAIDGAPAARFLQELCKFLENFSIMLVK
ncbi:MAG: 2-oxo acid dehydrogenase subunit E2 [Clostridia bacterium]|nr:2-oxo acid dehydrogenase subunit E2 [Clostridia bacterium]